MSVLYINFKNTGIIYLLNEIILFVYCYAATCILQIIFAMEKILDLEIKKS